MNPQVVVFARSSVGRVRKNNEDRYFADEADAIESARGLLLIVADGMGGHAAGEIAAGIAVDVIPRVCAADDGPDGDALAAAAHAAHAAIRQRQTEDPATDGMGATLVAAIVRPDRATVVHLGDARAYLLRGAALTCLTRDHTLGAESPELPPNSPYARSITRSLGQPDEDPEPEVHEHALVEGDRLLLCSDGLWAYISEAALYHGLADPEPAEALVEQANRAGGQDNVTAVVAGLGGNALPSPVVALPAAAWRPLARRSPWLRILPIAIIAVACLALAAWLGAQALQALLPETPAKQSRAVAASTTITPAAGLASARATDTLSPPSPTPAVLASLPASEPSQTPLPTMAPTIAPPATSTLAPTSTPSPVPTRTPSTAISRTPTSAGGVAAPQVPSTAPTRAAPPSPPAPTPSAGRVSLLGGDNPDNARARSVPGAAFVYANEKTILVEWDQPLPLGEIIQVNWVIDDRTVFVIGVCTETVLGCIDTRLTHTSLRASLDSLSRQKTAAGLYRYEIRANGVPIVRGSFRIVRPASKP